MVKELPAAEFSPEGEGRHSLLSLIPQSCWLHIYFKGLTIAPEVLSNSSPVFQAKIHFRQKGCLLQNETPSCLEEKWGQSRAQMSQL